MSPRDARRAPSSAGLFVTLALAACGGPLDPDGGARHEVRLYTPVADGALEAMTDATELELRLGFQGFVFGRVALELPPEAPLYRSARLSLRVEGEAPTTQNVSFLEYECERCPARRTAPLLLFANDVSPRSVAGRPYELRVELFEGSSRGAGRAAGRLRWDPGCVEQADGSCARADAGAAP